MSYEVLLMRNGWPEQTLILKELVPIIRTHKIGRITITNYSDHMEWPAEIPTYDEYIVEYPRWRTRYLTANYARTV